MRVVTLPLPTAAALLAALVTVFAVWLWREYRGAKQREAARHLAQMSQSKAVAEVEHDLAAQRERHTAAIAQLESEVTSAHDTQVAVWEHLSKSLATELASRRQLVAAVASLGIDALVASHLHFLTTDPRAPRPRVCRVDHLVVTDQFVLLIEHRDWRGVVFDARQPSRVHAMLSDLVDESELETEFAVRLEREKQGAIAVQRFTDISAPRAAAREKATQLAQHLGSGGTEVPWINTCVFYSQSGARVLVGDGQRGHRGQAHTFVAVRERGIARIIGQLVELYGTEDSPQLVRQLGPSLEKIATDMCGVGRWASKWPDLRR